MDKHEAETLARKLMAEHGVGHLEFGWTNARRTFGIAQFRVKKQGRRVLEETPIGIRLSSVLVGMNDAEEVRKTVLHEIAHLLAGAAANHGWQWKVKCMEIGADPSRTCGDGVTAPAHRWVGRCNNGHQTHADRLTAKAKKSACARCCRGRFNPEHVWQWERNDEASLAEQS